MGNIIDLDVLVPEDKRVTFHGRTYTLPGDMPMATYLRVSKIGMAQEQGASQDELLGDTVAALVELFCWRLPEGANKDTIGEELTATFRGMGVRTIMAIISKVYPADDGDQEQETDADAVVEDPTPPVSGMTPTTTSPPE